MRQSWQERSTLSAFFTYKDFYQEIPLGKPLLQGMEVEAGDLIYHLHELLVGIWTVSQVHNITFRPRQIFQGTGILVMPGPPSKVFSLALHIFLASDSTISFLELL